MKDISWFVNRMKAMDIREILWRMQQKALQKTEYVKYYRLHLPVTEIPISAVSEKVNPQRDQIVLNLDNTYCELFEQIDLFGVYDYKKYKSWWNAGFQTDNQWPSSVFSYRIKIAQREDIGDIRTNWELNRHFQFVGLAKNFYVSGDRKYLSELQNLFNDWNEKNLFLHGVQWTSAMEISIRIISWVYMYCFVEAGFEKHNLPKDQRFMKSAENGIWVMTNYVIGHRARFSSANNHLIVEMLGVGVAGFFFNNKKWIELSVNILTEELPKQNSADGVNREMSLHYQSFVMEAYGIMWLHMEKNGIEIPTVWMEYLTHMSEFLADCCGEYGEAIIFGDNDEGKILDFCGHIDNYYHYVLQLMSIILDKRYTDTDLIENVFWLGDKGEVDRYSKKSLYLPGQIASYRDGGYTILRSKDRRILIGFDHAELGFGNLAAHGHADALSLQLFYKGEPVLVDSGTYNYHVPKNKRDEMRCTEAHNTVYAGVEQAEMQGPFLWGRRFAITPVTVEQTEDEIMLSAKIDYEGVCHTRCIYFDFDRRIAVKDCVSGISKAVQVWNVADCYLDVISTEGSKQTIEKEYSESYNHLKTMITIKLSFEKEIKTYVTLFHKE